MNLHPKIRFVAIVNVEGRLMVEVQRDGVLNYLTPEEERQSLRHATDAWKLQTLFTSSIGHGRYTLTEYDRIKRITIPIDYEHLIYLTTELDANHTFVINQILKSIELYTKTANFVS